MNDIQNRHHNIGQRSGEQLDLFVAQQNTGAAQVVASTGANITNVIQQYTTPQKLYRHNHTTAKTVEKTLKANEWQSMPFSQSYDKLQQILAHGGNTICRFSGRAYTEILNHILIKMAQVSRNKKKYYQQYAQPSPEKTMKEDEIRQEVMDEFMSIIWKFKSDKDNFKTVFGKLPKFIKNPLYIVDKTKYGIMKRETKSLMGKCKALIEQIHQIQNNDETGFQLTDYPVEKKHHYAQPYVPQASKTKEPGDYWYNRD